MSLSFVTAATALVSVLLFCPARAAAAECDCKHSGLCPGPPAYYVCVLVDQMFDYEVLEIPCRRIVQGQPVITDVWVKLYYSECVHEPPLTCTGIIEPINSNWREYLTFEYLDGNSNCSDGTLLWPENKYPGLCIDFTC
jgi:hypothetical protein